MARNSYRNFMRLLEKWPVDATKSADRDLGEYLRRRVTEGFKQGEASAVNEEECHRLYSSLNRIASGVYAAKNPRSLTSTATGLSAEECHQIVSDQFMKAMEEQNKNVFQRVLQGGRQLRGAARKLRVLSEVRCLPSRNYSLQDKGKETNFGVEGNDFIPPTSPQDGTPSPPHTPVMADEVLEFLAPRDGSVILDMTFGGGGHSRRLLAASSGVRLVCLDRDPVAHRLAQDLQKEHPRRVLPLLGKFSELPALLTRLKINQCFFDGILMDLGVSNMQFNIAERGFMLSQNGPLDMRMDGGRDPEQITAADAVAHLDEDSLYKVLKYYGEESKARIMARALVEARYLFPRMTTTKDLANFVASVMEGEQRKDKLGRRVHPATKIFQALRILVNNELNELDYGMRLAHYYMQPEGVLVTLSFHSLEDTIIKRHFQGVDMNDTPGTIGQGIAKHRTALSTYSKDEMEHLTAKPWKPLTKHVVLPSEEEVASNPRARSAKLRAALRL